MMNKEEAVLQVRDLLLRYGNGCEYCSSRQPLEKNRCPRCGTCLLYTSDAADE